MILSLVVAVAKDNAIGKDNQLLWHLPADLKHFKRITSGHSIIMGRKTYESIGRPLPNRRNIVITRNLGFQAEGCEVTKSLEEALQLCVNEEEVFVIGGAEIYKLALPQAQRIYLTRVDATFDADAFFPEIDDSVWKTDEVESHKADEKNPFDYSFATYSRM